MKRQLAILLVFLMLCGCAAGAGEKQPAEPEMTGETASPLEEPDSEMKKPEPEQLPEKKPEVQRQEPCALNVICGEQRTAAMGGSWSWWYDNGDGTQSGIEACGIHPLDGEQYIPALLMTGPEAQLQFEGEEPDRVTVRCWNTEFWGQTETESEPAEVDGLRLLLKNGAYVYEVAATWERFDSWGGTAYYTFYTVLEN